MSTRNEQVLQLARQAGVLRTRDLQAQGISRAYLARLTKRGLLDRIDRGLYLVPDAPVTEHHSLAEVAKRFPQGVVCLLSALDFHHLTTQAPFEVWLAIDGKAHRPQVGQLPLRLVRFSGQALTYGVEVHQIEGVPVRITNPAKTVADCFKYRYKIGLEVALEALHQAWQERRATLDEFWQAAQVCRVSSVMRPYLEVLAA